MTGHKTTAMPSFVPVVVPGYVLKHHKHVTLTADFMFLQGTPYLHTKSHKLILRTLQEVPNRKMATMSEELLCVVHIYTSRGFEVVEIITDMEFECVGEDILPIKLTVVGKRRTRW